MGPEVGAWIAVRDSGDPALLKPGEGWTPSPNAARDPPHLPGRPFGSSGDGTRRSTPTQPASHPPTGSLWFLRGGVAGLASHKSALPSGDGGKADKGADKQGGGGEGLLPLSLPPSLRPLLPCCPSALSFLSPFLGCGSKVPSRAIHSPALPAPTDGWASRAAGCVSGERPRHLRLLSPVTSLRAPCSCSPRCHTWRGRPVGTARRLGLAAAPLHPGCRWPELDIASQRP